jgi:hypothetical protein
MLQSLHLRLTLNGSGVECYASSFIMVQWLINDPDTNISEAQSSLLKDKRKQKHWGGEEEMEMDTPVLAEMPKKSSSSSKNTKHHHAPLPPEESDQDSLEDSFLALTLSPSVQEPAGPSTVQ